MASIINASTSGAGGLIQTADSSGVLALQAAGTTIASVSSTGVAITGTVADSLGTLRPLVSGTAVASTSGTSIDFTSIPSWVKRITVMFNGVSTNGGSQLRIQLGSGSVDTSGYVSTSSFLAASASTSTSTSGFDIKLESSSHVCYGSVALSLVGSNIWVASGVVQSAGTPATVTVAGGKTLSGALDRVRITTVNGTDTFDAGSINIMYE